jgi:serine/threonine protein kinase
MPQLQNGVQEDDVMLDVTSAMEIIQIPDSDSPKDDDGRPGSSCLTPDPKRHRPWDAVAAAGPAANPIPFDKPRFERGRRDDVLVYIQQTSQHNVARNVLFRDFSREDFGDADGGLTRVQQAYWPLPYKENINTIMGHVEICVVLSRCMREQSDRDDDDHCDSSTSSSDNGASIEEDIVFQVTKKYVAVKVCYCDRMDRLRDKHAEDPLKEIGAMQLIGNNHPNVMGTVEVLFDGQNLNVVMPYCGSGDLFEMLQESQQIGKGFLEGVARYWFRQIMAGIQYLHAQGVCHRDLSPENIMIDHDGCLIIDMGMAIRIPYTDPNKSNDPANVTNITRGTQRRLIQPQGACGKLPYMSP